MDKYQEKINELCERLESVNKKIDEKNNGIDSFKDVIAFYDKQIYKIEKEISNAYNFKEGAKHVRTVSLITLIFCLVIVFGIALPFTIMEFETIKLVFTIIIALFGVISVARLDQSCIDFKKYSREYFENSDKKVMLNEAKSKTVLTVAKLYDELNSFTSLRDDIMKSLEDIEFARTIEMEALIKENGLEDDLNKSFENNLTLKRILESEGEE